MNILTWSTASPVGSAPPTLLCPARSLVISMDMFSSNDDLLQHVLAHIQHRAAMQVCKAWRSAWFAGGAVRRGLRSSKALLPPQVTVSGQPCWFFDVVALPGGELLAVALQKGLCIMNKQMQVVKCWEIHALYLAVGNGHLFVSSRNVLYRLKLQDFSLVAERNFYLADQGWSMVYSLALAPEGQLFANSRCHDERYCSITLLDSMTLETRLRFGEFAGGSISSLAIVGAELFVGHKPDHSIRVFSLAGEPLRQITGDWREPADLCFVNERLYLIESREEIEDIEEAWVPSWWHVDRPNAIRRTRFDRLPNESMAAAIARRERLFNRKTGEVGRRIFVLTPQGDVLETYDCRPHLQMVASDGGFRRWLEKMVAFDGKLLVVRGECFTEGFLMLRGV